MEVAKFEPKEQDRLLKAAVDNHWTVRELRDEIKKKKNPEITPPPEENIIEEISNAAITYLERVTKDLKRSEVAQVLAINKAFGVRPDNGIGAVVDGWERVL